MPFDFPMYEVNIILMLTCIHQEQQLRYPIACVRYIFSPYNYKLKETEVFESTPYPNFSQESQIH